MIDNEIKIKNLLLKIQEYLKESAAFTENNLSEMEMAL